MTAITTPSTINPSAIPFASSSSSGSRTANSSEIEIGLTSAPAASVFSLAKLDDYSDQEYFMSLATHIISATPLERGRLRALLYSPEISTRSLKDASEEGIASTRKILVDFMYNQKKLLSSEEGILFLTYAWNQISIAGEFSSSHSCLKAKDFAQIARLYYCTDLPISIRHAMKLYFDKIFPSNPVPSSLFFLPAHSKRKYAGDDALFGLGNHIYGLAVVLTWMLEGRRDGEGSMHHRIHANMNRGYQFSPKGIVKRCLEDFSSIRNVVFNQQDEPVPMKNYKALMLYIIRSLKINRTLFYEDPANIKYTEEGISKIEKMDREGNLGLLKKSELSETEIECRFEYFARKIVSIEDALSSSCSDKQINALRIEFFEDYKKAHAVRPHALLQSLFDISTNICPDTLDPQWTHKPIIVFSPPKELIELAKYFQIDEQENPIRSMLSPLEKLANIRRPPYTAFKRFSKEWERRASEKTREGQQENARLLLAKIRRLPASLQRKLRTDRFLLESALGVPEICWKAISKNYTNFTSFVEKLISSSSISLEGKQKYEKFRTRYGEFLLGKNFDQAKALKNLPRIIDKFITLKESFLKETEIRGFVDLLESFQAVNSYFSELDRQRSRFFPMMMGAIEPLVKDGKDITQFAIEQHEEKRKKIKFLRVCFPWKEDEIQRIIDDIANRHKLIDDTIKHLVFSNLLSEIHPKEMFEGYNNKYHPKWLGPMADHVPDLEYYREPCQKLINLTAELTLVLQKKNSDEAAFNLQLEEAGLLIEKIQRFLIDEFLEVLESDPDFWIKMESVMGSGHPISPDDIFKLLIETLSLLESIQIVIATQWVKCAKQTGKVEIYGRKILSIASKHGYKRLKSSSLDSARKELAQYYSEALHGIRSIRGQIMNNENATMQLAQKNTTLDSWIQLAAGASKNSVLQAVEELLDYYQVPSAPSSSSSNVLQKIFSGAVAKFENPVIGKIVVIAKSGRSSIANRGDIVVMPYAIPDLHVYREASMVIFQEGGMFSHGAIILDELKIPGILGAANAVRSLQAYEGKWVIIEKNRHDGKPTLTVLEGESVSVAEMLFQAKGIDSAVIEPALKMIRKEIPQRDLQIRFIAQILDKIATEKSPKSILEGLFKEALLNHQDLTLWLSGRKRSRADQLARLQGKDALPIEQHYILNNVRSLLLFDLEMASVLQGAHQQNLLLELQSLPMLSPLKPPKLLLPGGKNDNLQLLSKVVEERGASGTTTFYVPPFAVVSKEITAHFFLQKSDGISLKERILQVLNTLDDPESKAVKIKTLLQNSVIEAARLTEVFDRAFTSSNGNPLIVRSSASMEDRSMGAAAGLFESIPNVKDLDSFLKAVKIVWSSSFSPRAIAYTEKIGNSNYEELFNIEMIVQSYIHQAKYSGVVFSAGKEDDWSQVGIQMVCGLGEGCDGRETAATIFIDSSNHLFSDIYQENPNFPVPHYVLKEIAKLTKELEGKCGHPIEMEFAGEKDTVALVQIRSIVRFKC